MLRQSLEVTRRVSNTVGAQMFEVAPRSRPESTLLLGHLRARSDERSPGCVSPMPTLAPAPGACSRAMTECSRSRDQVYRAANVFMLAPIRLTFWRVILGSTAQIVRLVCCLGARHGGSEGKVAGADDFRTRVESVCYVGG